MGRRYIVPFNAVAVTVAQDLFEVLAPATKCLRLLRCEVTQESDAGDAQSEQLRFTLKRAAGTYTSGSGGSAPTVQKTSFGDAASGVTAEANNTTRAAAGTGTLDTLESLCENIHNGLHYIAPQGREHEFAPSQAIVVGLENAPVDSLTMSGVLEFEEIG